jgi:hypothetical protein
MDLLDGHLVDRGLGLSKALKDCGGMGFRAGRKISFLDHAQDVVEVAVFFGFRDLDVKLKRTNAASFDGLERYVGPNVERMDGAGDRGRVGPGVGQGANQHVAAKSRKCVQIAELHESRLWQMSWGLGREAKCNSGVAPEFIAD